MLNHIYKIVLFFLASISTSTSFAQTVSLEEVLELVVEKSFAARTAQIQKDIAGQNYKFYKSFLKPSLSVNGSIPNFVKTSTAITQPDGTISFQSIRQSNGSLSAFASQVIPATGGSVFINSDIRRFDDFSFSSHQYNGVPIRLGINQPILGFNPWKHEKRIQDFSLAEAQLNYSIQIEESLGIATDLYFDILISKQNLEIARTNQEVNERLLAITEERLLLGKVSKAEKLQLEIELNNARLEFSRATSQVEQTIAGLYTFLGIALPDTDAEFEVPENMELEGVDIASIISTSKKYRPEIIAYQKEKAMSDRDLAQAKADYGMQANLIASIGLARGSELLREVYTDPFDEQQFNITLSIPILDWGKKEAITGRIKLQQEALDAAYNQQILELENGLEQRAMIFSRLVNELKILEQIMTKAEERFEISNKRYVLGNIDITNLTLAQREKDQTKRDFINALKSYWVGYYEIRALSGYDVLNKKEINY